jgi:hypothetical protein
MGFVVFIGGQTIAKRAFPAANAIDQTFINQQIKDAIHCYTIDFTVAVHGIAYLLGAEGAVVVSDDLEDPQAVRGGIDSGFLEEFRIITQMTHSAPSF